MFPLFKCVCMSVHMHYVPAAKNENSMVHFIVHLSGQQY